MKKTVDKQVLVRLPVPLVKRLDAAAKRQQRSRTAEIRIRLDNSLRKAATEVSS